MRIEIDQSGRIEYTNKLTAIAFSNSKNHTIIISSKNKKYIQQLFRKSDKSNLFVYKTFSCLIFYAIKKYLKSIDQIIIDQEYTGYDKLIRKTIVEIAKKCSYKIDEDIIHFKQIGKHSNAHKLAINAFRKKRANVKVKYQDIISLII